MTGPADHERVPRLRLPPRRDGEPGQLVGGDRRAVADRGPHGQLTPRRQQLEQRGAVDPQGVGHRQRRLLQELVHRGPRQPALAQPGDDGLLSQGEVPLTRAS